MRTTRFATAATALLLSALTGSATAQTCYSGVNIFAARGTGESAGLGVSVVHINAITDRIPNSNAVAIDYPALFTNNSGPIGAQNGTRQLESYLDACPDSKVVIMGYSQGAIVQGYVLTGANFTIGPDGTATPYYQQPLPDKYANQIVAIVFFGDPGFNINYGINSDAPYPCNTSSFNPRSGDLWASYSDRLQEWCNYSDEYCCSTGTTFAGHVSYFGPGNATITGEFVAAKYNAAVGGGAQPASSSAVPSSTTVQTTAGPTTSPQPTTLATSASTTSSTTTTTAATTTTSQLNFFGIPLPVLTFPSFSFPAFSLPTLFPS